MKALYFLVLVAAVLRFTCSGSVTIDSAAERAALILFYEATGGAGWTLSDATVPSDDSCTDLGANRWDITNNSSNYCCWFGILCGYINLVTKVRVYGVRQIGLAGSGLAGTLPSSDTWCGSLPILDALLLSNNTLNGPIPVALARCTGMVNFDVSNNQLSGTLPQSLSSWSSELRRFQVKANRLTGTIPASYGAWTSLWQFSAQSNSLTGTLPTNISRWSTSLREFSCQSNRLEGTLPPEFSGWTGIASFDVFDNHVSGSLPPQYSTWTQLTFFRAASNPLTGTLPSSYSAWSHIQQILIYATNVSGTLPFEWSSLATLTTLLFFQNQLSGTLPASFGNLSNLTTFNVAVNSISGSLPAAWARLTGVESMILQDNPDLSGEMNVSWRTVFSIGSLPTVVSICRTNICAPSKITSLGFGCIPSSNIFMLSGIGLSTIASLFAIATWTDNQVTSSCSPMPIHEQTHHVQEFTRTATTPPSQNLENNTNTDDVASATSIAVPVVALAGSLLGGANAAELQMLSSVLSSPCMCGGPSGMITQQTKQMSFTTSPFAQLGGPEYVVFGNIGAMITITLTHCAAVMIVRWTNGVSSVFARSRTTSALGEEKDDAIVISSLRFPSVSIQFILFLVPGTFKATVGSATTAALTTHPPAETIAACVVGLLSVCALAVLLEVCVYRQRILTMPLKFFSYKRRLEETNVPKKVALLLLPSGFWGPQHCARQYAVLVGGLRGRRFSHLWRLLPCANLMIQLLSSVPGNTDGGCNALLALCMFVALATAVVWATLRPARTLMVGIMTVASLVAVAAVTGLGFLCRYQMTSESDVLLAALAASCVGMASTIVSTAVGIAENVVFVPRAPPANLQSSSEAAVKSIVMQHNTMHIWTTNPTFSVDGGTGTASLGSESSASSVALNGLIDFICLHRRVGYSLHERENSFSLL